MVWCSHQTFPWNSYGHEYACWPTELQRNEGRHMSRALTVQKARKKGFATAAAGTGTVLLFAFVSPWLGFIGAGATAYLGYKWLRFRGEWGLRF